MKILPIAFVLVAIFLSGCANSDPRGGRAIAGLGLGAAVGALAGPPGMVFGAAIGSDIAASMNGPIEANSEKVSEAEPAQ